MKKATSLFLAAAMLLTMLAGCGNGNSVASEEPTTAAFSESRTFTDSTGREVNLPVKISRIAVTGPLTQIALFSLAPDMLVGISSAWSDSQKKHIPKKYHSLPVLGQLYGGKSEMNLESLLAAKPQVVIDIGDKKSTIAEDMDKLTQQSGIPFIHIDATMATYDDMYITLGKLLGMEQDAKVLADYCNDAYSTAQEISQKVEKANMLYIVGDSGLNVVAKGSYHSEMIDLLCNNLAVVDTAAAKGTGNEVDMEQILKWNPDCVIFESGSLYNKVSSDPNWQKVKAIADKNYYETPINPYNWMGFPPSVQRMLGLLWIAKVLYPNEANYDMYEKVHTYYDLFYHDNLTQEQFDELTANSLGEKK